ncbi:GDSL-type esterase/lipase family protein [Streptomyces sp. NPDC087300]|uniref:GDSL-type esterase/lipase family protein n=1 Tax=Streptomyces sp. NPDC087300 TaxID=3365780 RepID=UPI0038200E33
MSGQHGDLGRRLKKTLLRYYSRAVLATPVRLDRAEIPPCSGRYGSGAGEPLRLALLGDSLALSVGAGHSSRAVGEVLAAELAATAHRPVDLKVLARFGTTATFLGRQVERLGRLDGAPGTAVVIVGGNDVLAPVRIAASAKRLAEHLGRLRDMGWSVVLASCPQIRHQPSLRRWVRRLAGRRSRRLAMLQTREALRAGARVVSLYDSRLLLRSTDTLLAGDAFHPSAEGYAVHLERMLPALLAASDVSTDHGGREMLLDEALQAAVMVPGLHCAPGTGQGLAVVGLGHHPLSEAMSWSKE